MQRTRSGIHHKVREEKSLNHELHEGREEKGNEAFIDIFKHMKSNSLSQRIMLVKHAVDKR